MRPGSEYKKWQRRSLGLSAVLIAASVGPAVYCMGWIPATEVVAGSSFGQCLAEHPLQFPTTIFVAGMLCGGAAFFFRVLRARAVAEKLAEQKRLDEAVRRAQIEDSVRRPALDRRQLRGASSPLPDAIDVDEEIRFGADLPEARTDSPPPDNQDTAMAFVEQQRRRQERDAARQDSDRVEERAALRGCFVPRGLEGVPVLYVDGSVETIPVADPQRRTDNPNLPFVDLEKALRRAFQIVMDEGTQVAVRVMPGVYQTTLEIPSRVTVINHRIPADATVDQRLNWLRQQTDVDHPERVTILAPSDSEYAIRAVPGRQQGLFGCYVVGRQGKVQSGLKLENCVATAVVHCAFESFSRSGTIVSDCGEDTAGRRIRFLGCLWQRNTTSRSGGAIRIQDSHVTIEASIFDSNRAIAGGAIAAESLKKPLVIRRCLLQRNRALCEEVPDKFDAIDLSAWHRIVGVGGAIVVHRALAKVEDTIIEGNDAAIGGGGVAALASRLVINCTEPGRGICHENRAGVGGGVLAVGWPEQPAMIRLRGGQLRKNLAKGLGGGGAALGNGVVHLHEVSVDTNHVAGGPGGFGGGLAAWKGGILRVEGGEVVANQASGGGGGIAAINGSLKITDQCSLNRNRAMEGSGGGVLALTVVDAELERLVSQDGFSLPFKIKIGEIRVSANQAAGPGGGLRGGNGAGEATFPMGIIVERAEWILDNSSESDEENGQNIWIRWGGRYEANDESRGRLKLVLK